MRPKAYVSCWPRGGAKSTTVELACARICSKLSRRFVLYVSETQEQANRHVQAIGTTLETLGIGRSINQYGNSKGWKLDMLRTANGFNVVAFGLDAGARGVKLDEFRPDVIVLDDIDGLHDSELTREKKRETITSTILPAGSYDCAVVFVQNRITEFSLMSEQADGLADWLTDKEPVSEEPAVYDLVVDAVEGEDGVRRWKILEGRASWEGQSLQSCEEQINLIGLSAFQRESQHLVKGATGIYFDVDRLQWIDVGQVPGGIRWCRAWDLAATRGAGDWTVGLLMGMQGSFPKVKVFLTDLVRGQWSSDEVRAKIRETGVMDGPSVDVRFPQDPGQAGKYQSEQLATDMAEWGPTKELPTGKKWVRARGFQAAVNLGNVSVVQGQAWGPALKDELRKFREQVPKQQDDQVDAAADAFNHLARYGDPEPVRKPKDEKWLPPALRDVREQPADPYSDFGDEEPDDDADDGWDR